MAPPVNGRSKPLTYEKDRFGLEGVLTILPRGNWTPLMYAARQGAVDATRALAEAGADLNLRDSEGTTALVRAIVNVALRRRRRAAGTGRRSQPRRYQRTWRRCTRSST